MPLPPLAWKRFSLCIGSIGTPRATDDGRAWHLQPQPHMQFNCATV